MEKWNQLESAVALFEETHRLQQKTVVLLQALTKIAERYESLEKSLPTAMSSKLEKALPSAADIASTLMVKTWIEAEKNAKRAAARYERAIKFSSLRIAGLALGCALAGAGSMIGIGMWVLPNAETVAKLKLEEEQYRSKIESMRRFGGDATISYCTDTQGRQRLCIQVEESSRTSFKGYRIIKGY